MSLRVLFCFAFVIWFSYYAWKNHFASLCAVLILMAAIQHPDMPKSIAGIQGLNPLNILLLNVGLAWWKKRKEEGWEWDFPPVLWKMFLAFVAVMTWGFLRMVVDRAPYVDETVLSAFSDYWINNVKWLLVGLMFFDSCRSEQRARIGLYCVIALFFMLAVQVIRWMPVSYAMESGRAMAQRASKIIQNEIGYNRVTLSMVLGGASWATLTLIPLFEKKSIRALLLFMAATITIGQALTGGRTGYFAWVLVGMVLCVLRFRYLLPIIPIGIALVLTFMPSVRERMLAGLAGFTGGNKGPGVQVEADISESTSGRTTIWPHVIEKIKDKPIIGYGRLAMLRTGLTEYLIEEENENFAHPHNAYLEQLFDNGIIGFLCVVPIFFMLLKRALQLLVDRSDVLFTAAGGVASALLLALLFGSMGGQTFYPRESAVGMWAALGVMLRVSVERFKSIETGRPLFAGDDDGDDNEDMDLVDQSPQPA